MLYLIQHSIFSVSLFEMWVHYIQIRISYKSAGKFFFSYPTFRIERTHFHTSKVKNGTNSSATQQTMYYSRVGVPTMSQNLTVDSPKRSFLILIKESSLIFWLDKPHWHASSAQLAYSAKLSRQARQTFCVEGNGPI